MNVEASALTCSECHATFSSLPGQSEYEAVDAALALGWLKVGRSWVGLTYAEARHVGWTDDGPYWTCHVCNWEKKNEMNHNNSERAIRLIRQAARILDGTGQDDKDIPVDVLRYAAETVEKDKANVNPGMVGEYAPIHLPHRPTLRSAPLIEDGKNIIVSVDLEVGQRGLKIEDVTNYSLNLGQPELGGPGMGSVVFFTEYGQFGPFGVSTRIVPELLLALATLHETLAANDRKNKPKQFDRFGVLR